jgi:LuxR family maltose regulon positive regulatory protein
MPLLINDLAALPASIVMVLDDYHAIENRRIHAALELLIEHLPPASTARARGSTAATQPPPCPRAVTEIRAAELR